MKIVLDTLGGDLGYKEHVAGAVEALKLKKAIEVFDLMAKFADYGFNKSHAAAYALL